MIDIDYKAVGNRIRQRRKQLSLTQKQLANLVNLSEGSVSRYESGSIKDATTQKLNDFAKALNVEVAWIIGFKPNTDKYDKFVNYYNRIQTLDDDTADELLNIFDKITELFVRSNNAS